MLFRSVLGEYDLVFASGRSALESLASGTAVIICNTFGLGPMVTAAEVDKLRTLNFGAMSTFGTTFDVDQVLVQVNRYSAEDATEASSRVRSVAGLDATVDRLLGLYADIIDEQRQTPPSADEEMRAVATYLRQVSDRVKASGAVQHEIDVARAENLQSRYDYGILLRDSLAIEAQRDRAVAERDGAVAERDLASAERDLASAERDLAAAELTAMRETMTWRIGRRLQRVKPLMRIHRLVRRRRT